MVMLPLSASNLRSPTSIRSRQMRLSSGGYLHAMSGMPCAIRWMSLPPSGRVLTTSASFRPDARVGCLP